MKISITRIYSIIFLLFTTASTCFAEQSKCVIDDQILNGCECGESLKNITLATPKGMHLYAVCGITEIFPNGSRKIDLSKERISLDEYPKNGGEYWGTFYFKGAVEQQGTLAFAPSPDTGVWWFTPSSDLAPYKSVFSDNYSSIFLDKVLPPEQPEHPENIKGFYTCLSTHIRLQFEVLEVELSNNTGAYALDVNILTPFEFVKISC
jgi:hypothetical protein